MDPETILHYPADETDQEPELSIVIPALNEELTIGTFVDWCHEGLRKAGVRGEILIIDSSTDKTREIALSKGARVLQTPRRGLGRAYLDAIPFIRGRYILMGDCDCTYDFREIAPFVEKLREGYAFVMGSRFKGYIQEGAMPPLHRYFGTPLTTWILNVIYSSCFTDIHCGMRGLTKTALIEMDLRSQSWEYASEMVLKSVHLKLRTAEVPIRFLKEPEGRESHHRRAGWLSPWKAGWINLRAMFIYGADFFLVKPGMLILLVGALLLFPLTLGPIKMGPVTLSLHWMLLGLCLSVLGLNCLYVGILAETLYDRNGLVTEKWLSWFRYNRAVAISMGIFTLGITCMLPLATAYIKEGFRLPELGQPSYLAVMGLFMSVAAFMTFSFTLVLHASRMVVKWR